MGDSGSIEPRRVAMGKLAAFFPLGAAESRTEMYLRNAAMAKVETRDLAEAVERLCVTRAEKSFPTLAVVLRVCGEASDDRRKAEHANREVQGLHKSLAAIWDAVRWDRGATDTEPTVLRYTVDGNSWNLKVNLVPFPTSLFTIIVPFISSTMFLTMASPRP